MPPHRGIQPGGVPVDGLGDPCAERGPTARVADARPAAGNRPGTAAPAAGGSPPGGPGQRGRRVGASLAAVALGFGGAAAVDGLALAAPPVVALGDYGPAGDGL